jgi:hypothetical protein
MPDRELRNLTPLSTPAAQGSHHWLLSVRNDVSRRIGQSARVSRTVGGKISAGERPSPWPDMFCS